jgi:hypothetical protein
VKQGDSDANALLKSQFSFSTDWMWINGATGKPEFSGSVAVTNTLDKKRYFDNGALPDYRVHLNVDVNKTDWDQDMKPSNSNWDAVKRMSNWGSFSFDALPTPPSFKLELFDIDFFMTTNLLLPNSKVIEFEAEPGVRFPRDLYLVGQIVHEDQVNARRAARAAFKLASNS